MLDFLNLSGAQWQTYRDLWAWVMVGQLSDDALRTLAGFGGSGARAELARREALS
jgi:hypothetical protein